MSFLAVTQNCFQFSQSRMFSQFFLKYHKVWHKKPTPDNYIQKESLSKMDSVHGYQIFNEKNPYLSLSFVDAFRKLCGLDLFVNKLVFDNV